MVRIDIHEISVGLVLIDFKYIYTRLEEEFDLKNTWKCFRTKLVSANTFHQSFMKTYINIYIHRSAKVGSIVTE